MANASIFCYNDSQIYSNLSSPKNPTKEFAIMNDQANLCNNEIPRKNSDRRSSHFKSLAYSLIKRRRHTHRRSSEDDTGYIVDIHEKKFWIFAAAIIILCGLDAVFTLNLLSMGAEEVNPFMKVLIETNIPLFIGVKMLITSIAVFLLLAHKKYWFFKNVIRVKSLVPMVLIMYVVLINYEIGLFVLDYSMS